MARYNPYELTAAEHDRRYKSLAEEAFYGTEPQERPRAVITGGQPASGKGTLASNAVNELAGEGGAVKIDADDLRDWHPSYAALQRENDREAASLVHPDAAKWAKRLTDDAIEARRNLVIDQTSRSPEALIARTQQLREAGYHVELRVMAVNSETSQQRVYTRYEGQKADDGVGRFVPKEVHDEAYSGLPESISAVERAKSVDAIKVYNKYQERIHEDTLHNGRWGLEPPRARVILDAERNRSLSIHDLRELSEGFNKISESMAKRGAEPAEREEIEALRLRAERRYAAETFRQLPKEEALKTHPQLERYYAAVDGMAAKIKEDGLSAEAQRIVLDRARYNVAAAVEQGKAPPYPAREAQAAPPEKAPEKDLDR